MLSASDLKKGVRFLFEDDPYTVMSASTQTPSARGASALVKAKIRNLKTGRVFDKSFKVAERFHEPDLERKPVQYLYDDGEQLVFMDTNSYDQLYIQRDQIGEAAGFLLDNLELKLVFFKGEVLDVELPMTIDYEVTEVEPSTKGDTVTGMVLKAATLENGLICMVPQYIDSGERVRVNTKDGSFSERAK